MLKKLLTKTNLILLVILLSAAFLRLYRIADYMTFLGDEGRDVLVVYNILHGHFTLLGPTASVGGFFLGPIYYYFMTPFLWLFNYNPVGPAIMVALGGIVTVWFVYFVGKRFFGVAAGLIAASLYAVSPLVIAYSRSSWNPNLMPLFSLLMLYLLYLGVNTESKKYFLLSGVCLGIALQLHYLTTFLGVIVALYTVGGFVYKKLVSKKNVMEAVYAVVISYVHLTIGFLVGWSPFLLFEVRHGFANTRSIVNFVLYSKDTGGGGQFWGIVQDVLFRVYGRLVTDFPPPEQISLQGHISLTIWYTFTYLLIFATSAFLVFILVKSWRETEKFLQYSLLFIWLVCGVLLFGFYKKQIYDYYFTLLFPLPFLLTGGLFAFLFKKHIVGKIFVVLSITSLFAINLQAIPFRYPPNRQLNQMESIARFVLDKTNGQPYNFALIAGGNSDYAYRYFLTVWNKPPVTIQFPGADPERKTITKQLLVVCETVPCRNLVLGNSLWEVAGFGRAEIAGEWKVSVVEIYRLTHYMGK